jgi:outer membrane protein assembly factor BamB
MNQNSQNTIRRSASGFAVIMLFALLFSYPGQAQNNRDLIWPHFRGLNGSGVHETSGLPKAVGPDTNVIWKRQVPVGYSSPVLNDKYIFLTAIEEGKLLTICLNRQTSATVWQAEAPRPREEPIDNRNNPASPTPAIDDQSVYVFFPDFGLLAYDFQGHELWSLPLGPFHNGYGMGASPIVAGNKVVLVCDQTYGSFIIAVDKKTGRLAWQKERPEAKSGHSTPIVYQPVNGELQIIIPGSFLLISYSANTGERLWWVNGLPCEMKATPVIYNDMVFTHGFGMPQNDFGNQSVIPAFDEALTKFDANKDGLIDKAELPKDEPYNQVANMDLKEGGKLDAGEWNYFKASLASVNSMMGIRLGGSGDRTDSGTVWRYYRRVPQLPSPLVYNNKLYMINDIGFVTIFNPADGTVIKEGRLTAGGSQFYSSPVAGDGKIFFVSRGGKVSVLNADGSTDIQAISDLKEECYATPAIADGRLYIRTVGTLYCFGVK